MDLLGEGGLDDAIVVAISRWWELLEEVVGHGGADVRVRDSDGLWFCECGEE